MASLNLKDSSEFVMIESCISSSKTNQWTNSNISSKYKIDGNMMDNPSSVLNKFMDIIKESLTVTELKQKYQYRPELFAKDYLGSSDLWWLVLMCTGLTSHTEFCTKEVKYPSPSMMNDIQSLIDVSADELKKEIEIKDLVLYPVKI